MKRRCRVQFGNRTLLGAVALTAIALGWWVDHQQLTNRVSHMKRELEQRDLEDLELRWMCHFRPSPSINDIRQRLEGLSEARYSRTGQYSNQAGD